MKLDSSYSVDISPLNPIRGLVAMANHSLYGLMIKKVENTIYCYGTAHIFLPQYRNVSREILYRHENFVQMANFDLVIMATET